MLTVIKVNNKNTRTISCCIYFNLLTHYNNNKSTEQLKCTLNNMAVSLKRVHVT